MTVSAFRCALFFPALGSTGMEREHISSWSVAVVMAVYFDV